MMAAPRKQKHTQAELAAMAGVSVRTIRTWRDSEGLDLGDVKAVMRRAGMVDRPGDDSQGESYSEARRRRAIADANRAEMLAKREADSVVDREVVDAVLKQVGAEFRARLMGMRGALVNELVGLREEQIYRVLDDRFVELLTAIFERRRIPKIKP